MPTNTFFFFSPSPLQGSQVKNLCVPNITFDYGVRPNLSWVFRLQYYYKKKKKTLLNIVAACWTRLQCLALNALSLYFPLLSTARLARYPCILPMSFMNSANVSALCPVAWLQTSSSWCAPEKSISPCRSLHRDTSKTWSCRNPSDISSQQLLRSPSTLNESMHALPSQPHMLILFITAMPYQSFLILITTQPPCSHLVC